MLIKNASRADIESALEAANRIFGGNLLFKRIEPANRLETRWRVTLKVKDSRGPGSRIGFHGQRVCAACWHAHGEFISNLPNDALVDTILGNDLSNFSRWIDRTVGSMARPVPMSQLCDCI